MPTRPPTPDPDSLPVIDIDDVADLAAQEAHDGHTVVIQNTPPGTAVAPLDQGNLPATREADQQVSSIVPVDDEWADVHDGDLSPGQRRIPYLKINRNLDGGFEDPDTGETTKELDLIWMAKGRSRVWFKEAFGVGAGVPACRSGDAITADPSSPDLQNHGDCTTCPRANFDEDQRGTVLNDKGREVPAPRCREAIEALVFIKDPHGAGRLARMRWGGIAVRPATTYWDSFFTRMPVVPPIGFITHVDLVPTDTDFGQKLAPSFTRVEQITRRDAQPLITARDERMKDWKADTADDIAQGVGHDDDGAKSGPFEDRSEEPFGPQDMEEERF